MAKTSGGVRQRNPYMSYSEGRKIYDDTIRSLGGCCRRGCV